MPQHILYLSFDGMLEPLGHSQVVRVLTALASPNRTFHILNLEKPKDLGDAGRVDALREHLASHGISWHPMKYEAGGIRPAMSNVSRLTMAATAALVTQRPALVHARGYLPALTASVSTELTGTPYIFDKRGFWVDERLDAGTWVTTPTRLAIGRMIERHLFARSAAVVSLTEVAAEEVLAGRFGRWPVERPLRVITTCADFDDFRLESHQRTLPEDVVGLLKERVVVGFIGSINPAYMVDESLDLFVRIKRLVPEAFFLGLTRQVDEMNRRAEAHGVAEEDRLVLTARHQDMPEWLSHLDWGLVMRDTTFSNLAAMPTKLGEFFASGVRPIHYGCNVEVGQWVARTGSGISLETLEAEALDAAAHQVHEEVVDGGLASLSSAREIASTHFSLAEGVRRYDALYEELAAHSTTSRTSL